MYEKQQIHFSLGRKITRTMRGNFREMKVACNIIFMSIFRAKVIFILGECFYKFD